MIGVIEEFTPLVHCYEQNGVVFSDACGKVQIDSLNHQVSVVPLKTISELKRGMLVVGYCAGIRKQAATVSIAAFRQQHLPKFTSAKDAQTASLQISNVSSQFLRSLHDGIRPGDYLLARINTTAPEIAITMVGRGLGVIYAACFRCGKEVTKVVKRNLIQCDNCGTTQSRALSNDFGRFDVFFPKNANK